MERIRLAAEFKASPEGVYEAWLDGECHAQMTGSKATSDARVGGAFTAWDGYIRGEHLELVPGKRILESWRTAEFPDTAPDSRLELRLAKTANGTRVTLLQSDIPDGQGEKYSEGWQTHYFDPMTAYFDGRSAPKKRGPAPGRKKKRAPRSGKKTARPPKRTRAPKKKSAKARSRKPRAGRK